MVRHALSNQGGEDDDQIGPSASDDNWEADCPCSDLGTGDGDVRAEEAEEEAVECLYKFGERDTIFGQRINLTGDPPADSQPSS